MKPSRRDLLKLIGVGAGTAAINAIVSDLPPVLDTFGELQTLMDEELGVVATIPKGEAIPANTPHRNPYLVTTADLGLCNKADLRRI